MKLSKLNSVTAVGPVAASICAVAVHHSQGSAGPDATAPERIPDALCLRKMTLDLAERGPTDDELGRLAAGEATLSELADELLGSEEFESVAWGWYKARFPPTGITPEGTDVDEPVRIATHILLSDMDYRNIVNGDFTVDAEGNVQPVTDRPAAGVLSTAHYMSAYSGSFRRNWAGHFLAEWGGVRLEAVSLPPDLDEADLAPASLLENPACKGCHGDEVWGVDYLAGFAQCYETDGSYRGGECAGKWLTVEGADLSDLGQITASSKRFKAQTVNFFFEKLFGRHIAAQETDYYITAQTALESTGFNARMLIKHLVTSDEYCSN